MKISEQVKVGAYAYQVTWHDELRNDQDVRLRGQCDHSAGAIRILRGQPADREVETFFHELIHAVECAWNLDLTEDEVAGLSLGLTATLRDNHLLRED